MGDFGREKIAASLARRFRDTAAEFAALAALVDIAADRQVLVLAQQRLERKSDIQFILSRRSLYAVANNHRLAVTASGPREAVDTRLRQMDR
jgi:hypothetical protein